MPSPSIADMARRGGYVSQEYRKCGTLGCACMTDPARRHGPYHIFIWREGGRKHRRYIPKQQVEEVYSALARRHAMADERRQCAAEIQAMRQNVRALQEQGNVQEPEKTSIPPSASRPPEKKDVLAVWNRVMKGE